MTMDGSNSDILSELKTMNLTFNSICKLMLDHDQSNEQLKLIEKLIFKNQRTVDFMIENVLKQQEAYTLEINSLLRKMAILLNPNNIGAARSNSKVFNDQEQPLFNAAVNAFDYGLNNTGFSRGNASIAGKMYCAVSGVISISQNNYYAFYFSNPSGSEKTAQFDIIEGSTKQMLNSTILKEISSFTSTATLMQLFQTIAI